MGKIRYGLKNVHVAFWDNEQSKYEEPIRVPGAVNMELDPVGEDSTFYADDVPYAQVSSNGGYTGTLEIADVPEEFLIKALSYWKDDNGAIIEDTDAVGGSDFALLYEVSGNEDKQRFLFYSVNATRPKVSATTKKDGTEAKTAELSFSAGTKDINGKPLVKAHIESGNKGFDTFFDKVYEPVKA